MDEDNLPDFLQLNGFAPQRRMFGATGGYGSGRFVGPISAALSPWPDAGAAFSQLSASSSAFPNPGLALPMPGPQRTAGLCPLVPVTSKPDAIVPSAAADLRFSPAFAGILSKVTDALDRQGIPLNINQGFRTAAEQARMRHRASGRNPAALYSDHQLGNAVDIDGTRSPSFSHIKQAFLNAGAKWGGDYRRKKDPPHFYIRPVRANAANTAVCEWENPL